MTFVIHGATGAFPPGLRRGVERILDTGGAAQLQRCCPAWVAAAYEPPARFCSLLLGPGTRADTAQLLQHMAGTIRTAQSHTDLAEASDDLAAAVQCTGLGNWPRFMHTAAATTAAASGSG